MWQPTQTMRDRVIQTGTGRVVESDQLPESQGNEALTQDVFHRLVHAQVGAE